MKNEIEKRRENKVLFEPSEPLFPDLPPRPSKIMLRIVAGAILLVIALVVWGLAVSANGEDNEDLGISDILTELETRAEDTCLEESWLPLESDYNGEPTDEITHTETPTEKETEKEPEETEPEDQAPPTDEVIETDLSLAERGNAYIVNYTDKAVEVSELLDRGFVDVEEKNSPAPLVMILHTHTSEAYHGSKNAYLDGVISAGALLNQKLNSLGLTAIHCTVIHDGGEGNAYIAARDTIETMLKIYPSIKYVIDLHRMDLESDGIPVKTVSEEGMAQIRLTVSADSAGWQESLSLALSLREKLNDGGTRLCMPPTLSPSRYNSDMSKYYLMVDIGATGNTAREAILAAERLARAIYDTVISK